jgi:DNA processing protein
LSGRTRTESEANSLMEEKHYWVALNMVQGIGRTLFRLLLESQGFIRNVFNSSHKQLLAVPGIGEKTAKEILSFEVEDRVERELNLADKLNCQILTLDSEEYPRILKTIYDPPPVLYFEGTSLNKNPATLTVVGDSGSFCLWEERR